MWKTGGPDTLEKVTPKQVWTSCTKDRVTIHFLVNRGQTWTVRIKFYRLQSDKASICPAEIHGNLTIGALLHVN